MASYFREKIKSIAINSAEHKDESVKREEKEGGKEETVRIRLSYKPALTMENSRIPSS